MTEPRHDRAGHRTRRGSQRVKYPPINRLHRIERFRDVPQQDLRIIVPLTHRDPREDLVAALGPLRQQRRLPITPRRHHRHDRAGIIPRRPFDQRRTADRSGPHQGAHKLRRDQIERRPAHAAWWTGARTRPVKGGGGGSAGGRHRPGSLQHCPAWQAAAALVWRHHARRMGRIADRFPVARAQAGARNGRSGPGHGTHARGVLPDSGWPGADRIRPPAAAATPIGGGSPGPRGHRRLLRRGRRAGWRSVRDRAC